MTREADLGIHAGTGLSRLKAVRGGRTEPSHMRTYAPRKYGNLATRPAALIVGL